MQMETTFTPKQVAKALGVSESSIKRWVDGGRIEAVRTAGGHRKLLLSSVVQLAREQGYNIVRPDVLGLAAESSKCDLHDAYEPLLETLSAGDEVASQAIIEPLYHAGYSMVDIADSLIAPVFHELGRRWLNGTLNVHQERRACEIAIATLYNLRRMLPLPSGDAPRALAATASDDHAELPVRLAELVLREKGWAAHVQGISLPLVEIRAAVERKRPHLALLSATHLNDPEAFVQQANEHLFTPTKEITRWIVGGQAFPAELREKIDCFQFSTSMAELAEVAEQYVHELNGQA